MLAHPNSIPTNFEIALTVPRHQLLALIGIKASIAHLPDDFPAEFRQQIENQVLTLLSSQLDSSVQYQTALAIAFTIIDKWRQPWQEFHDYVFSPNLPIMLSLQSLSQYIFRMSSPQVMQHLQLFFQLIMTGLANEEANIELQLAALEFYSLLIIHITSPSVLSGFSCFQEPLYAIFVNVLSMDDPQIFTEMTKHLSSCIDHNFFPIPHELMVPALLQSLLKQGISPDYMAIVHSFLSRIVQVGGIPLDDEQTLVLFSIEINVCQSLFLLDQDSIYSWMIDVDIMYQEIFLRMPQELVYNYSMEKTNELIQSAASTASAPESAVLRITAIILLQNAISAALEAFDLSLPQVFEIINGVFVDVSLESFVRTFAIRAFTELSCVLSPLIDFHLTELIASTVEFIKLGVTEAVVGVDFIRVIIEESTDTDAIFVEMIPFATSLVGNADPSLQANGLIIISYLIHNSPYNVHAAAPTLLPMIMSLLQADRPIESPRSLSYLCLSSLIDREPDFMKHSLPDIIEAVKRGLLSGDDNSVQMDAIIFIMDSASGLMPEFGPVSAELFVELTRIVDHDWNNILNPNPDPHENEINQSRFKVASAALRAMAHISSLVKDPEAIAFTLQIDVRFAGTCYDVGQITCLNVYQMLIPILTDEMLAHETIMANHLLLKQQLFLRVGLITDPHQEIRPGLELISSVLSCLTASLKQFGPSIVDEPQDFAVKLLTCLLDKNQYTGELQFDQSLFGELENTLGTLVGISGVWPAVEPFFVSLFDAKPPRVVVFVIETVAAIIAQTPSLFTEQFQQTFFLQCAQMITTGTYRLSRAAAYFFIVIATTPQTAGILSSTAPALIQSICTRLATLQEVDFERLRATLVALMSALMKSQSPPAPEAIQVFHQYLSTAGYSDEAYMFAIIACHNNPDSPGVLLPIFVNALARPYTHVMSLGLTPPVLRQMIAIVEANPQVIQTLGDDQMKLQCLNETCGRIKQEFGQ